MTPDEVYQIYQTNIENTAQFISKVSNNGVLANATITNTYMELAHQDPAFLWLSLGTLVSGTVGQNIHFSSLVDSHTFGQVESATTVMDAFATGNQAIFKSILPLYQTYQQVGVEGIALLNNHPEKTPFKEESIINAFTAHAEIQQNQFEIAQSLGLPSNDPKVIDALFNDQSSLLQIKNTAYKITEYEQNYAQDKIYNDYLIEIMTDPALGIVGHQFKLDGINIDGKDYNMLDYIDNPGDVNQRMAFVEVLIQAGLDSIQNKGLEHYLSDITDKADYTLWLANPFMAPDKIGETNGYFWGQKADEYNQTLLAEIKNFLEQEPISAYHDYLAEIDIPFGNEYWQNLMNEELNNIFPDTWSAIDWSDMEQTDLAYNMFADVEIFPTLKVDWADNELDTVLTYTDSTGFGDLTPVISEFISEDDFFNYSIYDSSFDDPFSYDGYDNFGLGGYDPFDYNTYDPFLYDSYDNFGLGGYDPFDYNTYDPFIYDSYDNFGLGGYDPFGYNSYDPFSSNSYDNFGLGGYDPFGYNTYDPFGYDSYSNIGLGGYDPFGFYSPFTGGNIFSPWSFSKALSTKTNDTQSEDDLSSNTLCINEIIDLGNNNMALLNVPAEPDRLVIQDQSLYNLMSDHDTQSVHYIFE